MHNLLNEFADLSQRLDHLVAYSSQMVFISGERMGNQKTFVEAFLGSREQNQDVVYLTGNSFHNEDDVRQEFTRQFTGNLTQTDLPLLQLLSNRSKDRPLLIAITRAERLPDQILQELWDLVLQNRFARNHQHINILLFGEQEWAERTKSWLPTNNNDKPVLLTSETVEVQSEQELEGDLDTYIQAKRKEFNERLKQRALSYETPESVWAKWWLKLLAACVFIMVFSGIMLWQYFDLTHNAAKEFASFVFQTGSSSAVEQWQQTKELLVETESFTVNEPVNDNKPDAESGVASINTDSAAELSSTFVTSWKKESEKLARQNIPIHLPVQQTPETSQSTHAEAVIQPTNFNTSGGMDMANAESVETISREQLLQFQGLTEGDVMLLPLNETVVQTSTEELPSQNEPTVIAKPLISNDLAGALAKNLRTEAALVGPPVPEILQQQSEQVDINTKTVLQASNISSEVNTDELINSSTEDSQLIATNDSTENISAVDDYPIEDIVTVEELVAQQRAETPEATQVIQPPAPIYLFNETALISLSEAHYLLQVSGMSSRTVLNEYLRDNQLNDLVWIYKTKRYGGDWFVVLYNKPFTSLNSARNGVDELPQTTRQSAPFAKSIAMIKAEIAQGYPL